MSTPNIPTIPDEIEELTKHWPEQVINNHERWWRAWMVTISKGYAHHTNYEYGSVGRTWAEFANGKNLNPRLIIEWGMFITRIKNNRGQPISAQRLIRYTGQVKRYLGWLKNVNVITADPGRFMTTFRIPRALPQKTFTHTEYRAVMKYASERDGRYLTIAWLWCLGYHTGMSLVDCCLLKWEDVKLRDDGPSYIQRIRAKMKTIAGGKAMCTIPILAGSEVWRWLKTIRADSPPCAVFVHRDAPNIYLRQQPCLHKWILKTIHGALGEQAANGRTFKNLRTTFASRLINSGADCIVVAKMTGHKNVGQLAEYVNPDHRKMQDAVHHGMHWAESEDLPPDPIPNLINMPPLAVSTGSTGEPSLSKSLASDNAEVAGAADSVNQPDSNQPKKGTA